MIGTGTPQRIAAVVARGTLFGQFIHIVSTFNLIILSASVHRSQCLLRSSHYELLTVSGPVCVLASFYRDRHLKARGLVVRNPPIL
jgi:hypothetical protein